MGTSVFIGHGGSGVWKDLKDFVRDRLALPYDEFNRVPVAGVANAADVRLVEELLDKARLGDGVARRLFGDLAYRSAKLKEGYG